jgi:hypothetical protein
MTEDEDRTAANVSFINTWLLGPPEQPGGSHLLGTIYHPLPHLSADLIAKLCVDVNWILGQNDCKKPQIISGYI